MPSTDLIFEPIKVYCPRCTQPVEISFETVQYDDEIACASCGRVFTSSVNAQRLFEMMKTAEAHLSKRSPGLK